MFLTKCRVTIAELRGVVAAQRTGRRLLRVAINFPSEYGEAVSSAADVHGLIWAKRKENRDGRGVAQQM